MRDVRWTARRCAWLLALVALALACLPAMAAAALKLQTVEIKSTPPQPARIGNPYTIRATATSGLEVKFSSEAPSVCEVGETTVNEGVSEAAVELFAAGECKLKAEQPGVEGEWEPAAASQQFPILRRTQTVTLKSEPPNPAPVGGGYKARAKASSGLAVVLVSATTSVCTVSESSIGEEGFSEATVTFVGEGACRIEANQVGDPQFEPAAATEEVPVVRRPQTIKFKSTPPNPGTVGGSYTVSAGATSGLSVELTVDPASASVCTISTATVSFIGAGTCTIDADQAGNFEYAPAVRTQQSFAVAPPVTISPPASPPATTAKTSSFKAISATLHSPSFTITLKEQVSDPGTLKWVLTFPNGTFGVFGAAANKAANGKCKAGFMRLGGKCRPKRVVFGKGKMSFATAGVVTITVKPSAAAKRALKTALRKKKNMRITAVLTFRPSNGDPLVTHTQLLTVKLSSAK